MSGWTDVRALLPGLRGPRVHVVAAADETALRSRLSGAGFDLVTVAGRAITNEGTLLQEMARAFALPEGFGDNWDALADALGDLAGRPTAGSPSCGSTPTPASPPTCRDSCPRCCSSIGPRPTWPRSTRAAASSRSSS